MMLSCIPQSVFNWDYRIEGANTGPAGLSMNFFTEQGSVDLAGEHFLIQKQGWLSGRWILEQGGHLRAEAFKPNPFTRRFEISTQEGKFALEAQSVFTRGFSIYAGNREIGTIVPAGMLTRRASINCHPSVPEVIQLFAFWLVVLTWRRSSENNAAPAS